MQSVTSYLVEIVIGTIGVIMTGLICVGWKLIVSQFKQHEDRLNAVENKVESILASELRQMNVDVVELRGELKVLRTDLKAALENTSTKLADISNQLVNSMTVAINNAMTGAVDSIVSTAMNRALELSKKQDKQSM